MQDIFKFYLESTKYEKYFEELLTLIDDFYTNFVTYFILQLHSCIQQKRLETRFMFEIRKCTIRYDALTRIKFYFHKMHYLNEYVLCSFQCTLKTLPILPTMINYPNTLKCIFKTLGYILDFTLLLMVYRPSKILNSY